MTASVVDPVGSELIRLWGAFGLVASPPLGLSVVSPHGQDGDQRGNEWPPLDDGSRWWLFDRIECVLYRVLWRQLCFLYSN